ncbi:serine esterase family protein [Purpureocillium lavendulum]|uniref:Serine esterase family protein n=1 Tax=Purpureocillium lavendulum TaxID=1247861 RepID=A0AB34FYX8_9HYPO|nr:serine esterase family protein [Purpureocillium lavendulum]
MPMRMRPRPRSYHEEMLVRQLQERRDAEVARNLQHSHDVYDEHDMMGGVGDIHGIGNASGHYMNDNYRRGGGRYMGPMQGPPRGTGLDRGADYVADVGRARGHRGDSLERRLVDRMSESRSGTGMRVPVMTPLSPPISPPMPSQMRGPPMGTPGALPGAPPGAPIPVEMIPRTMAQGRGGLRHHSLEEELYNRSPHTPRSERVVGGRMSRNYQDEADIHAPRGTRQRPRSSDMAGLSSYGGQGMGRVSQWRTYVEPGIPDGESVVGHA